LVVVPSVPALIVTLSIGKLFPSSTMPFRVAVCENPISGNSKKVNFNRENSIFKRVLFYFL
jgi:hypothetical protein